MSNCDFCRRLIVPTDNSMNDIDKIWDKEYYKRKDLEINKQEGIKKIIYKIFYGPTMPFYPRDSFSFCSKECYNNWKKIAKKRFEETKIGVKE